MEDVITGETRNDAHASETKQTAGFAQILAASLGDQVADDQATYLPLEDTTGRSVFIPKTDENRPVELFPRINGTEGVLRIKRTGQNASQGCYLNYEEVESNFELKFSRLKERTQMNLVMANGKTFVGYVVRGKTRHGIYIPKKLTDGVIVPPPHGKLLPIKIIALIAG
jgi:hypothetical protein